MNQLLRAMAGAILTLTTLGCTTVEGSRYEYFIAPGHEGAPGAQRWLVVPANFDSSVPEYLAPGADRIPDAIIRYLEDCGRDAETMRMSEITDVHAAVLRDGVSGEVTRAELSRRLAQSRQVDVVLYPTLVSHAASVQGTSATWHGVRRRSRVIEHKPKFAGKDTPNEGVGMLSGRGSMAALSLGVQIHFSDGRKLFESYGGLELIDEIHVFYEQGRGWMWQARKRQDLLQAEIVREGASVALNPYVVLLEASPD